MVKVVEWDPKMDYEIGCGKKKIGSGIVVKYGSNGCINY